MSVFATVDRGLLHQVPILSVPTDKQNNSPSVGDMRDDVQRIAQILRRDVQIEDQLAKSFPENKLAHPVVQRADHVAEMHAILHELLHSEEPFHVEKVGILQYFPWNLTKKFIRKTESQNEKC